MKNEQNWIDDSYALWVRDCLLQVLDRNTPSEHGVDRYHIDTGEDVFGLIQDFIHFSLKLNSNPLPTLRRIVNDPNFPSVEWKHHSICLGAGEIEEDKKMLLMINSCDIFWTGLKGYNTKWFTLTRKAIPKLKRGYMSICAYLDDEFVKNIKKDPRNELDRAIIESYNRGKSLLRNKD